MPCAPPSRAKAMPIFLGLLHTAVLPTSVSRRNSSAQLAFLDAEDPSPPSELHFQVNQARTQQQSLWYFKRVIVESARHWLLGGSHPNVAKDSVSVIMLSSG